ncbi:MAG: helix-turn-helix transcriptional regulator [Lewinellaceae bacterium]|nr:helix-turn-helix transcriptional regulator [Lewinellaceae bacterium]
MQALADILRFATLGCLALFIPLLLRSNDRREQVYTASMLSFTIICYLLVDWPPLQGNRGFFILLPFAFSMPFVFWLSSRALFDDHFRIKGWMGASILGYVALQTALFFLQQSGKAPASGLTYHALSLLMVALAIVEAGRNRAADLIVSRQRFRNLFIILTALLIGLTVLTRMSFPVGETPLWIELLHLAFIAGLTFYFAVRLLAFQPGFLAPKETPDQPSPKPEIDRRLVDQLLQLMEAEKYYRTEGLTIRQLAEKMEVKEYKLRQTINQHLGFRNFNDFLNSYRIQEACALLTDPGRREFTVLEIAYEMGYLSLAPFNKAFRENTGMTPTEYRKKNS